MKKLTFGFYLIILITQQIVAQTYKSPESIVYDAANKRYLISNNGGNTISQLDSLNQISNFVTTGLNAPKGLLIIGDTLIVANNTNIQGFLLSDASRVINISIAGASFLNDVTTDEKGTIYVTDMQTNKLHAVALNSGTYSTLTSALSSPNGVLYLKNRNSILLCSWGGNAKIQSFNLATSELKTLVTTKLSDLDGLATDNCGNIYVSSWGRNAVYVFDSLFEKAPTNVSKGHSGPADISIIPQSQTLCIPNFNSNKLDFVNLNQGCAIDIDYLLPENKSIDLNDSIMLDWESVVGITEYELEYSKDSMFYTGAIQMKTNDSEAIIKGLAFNTRYFWRVRAIGADYKNIYNKVWSFTTIQNTTGTAEYLENNKLRVYPNPASQYINIEFAGETLIDAYYTIFDVAGKTVQSGKVDAHNIELSTLHKGLYLLRLSAGNEIMHERIVIE